MTALRALNGSFRPIRRGPGHAPGPRPLAISPLAVPTWDLGPETLALRLPHPYAALTAKGALGCVS